MSFLTHTGSGLALFNNRPPDMEGPLKAAALAEFIRMAFQRVSAWLGCMRFVPWGCGSIRNSWRDNLEIKHNTTLTKNIR